MKPVFSIGIAFRNPGQYFSLALQSVFAQTCSDWELILVDDGSTDGSVELARSLDDPRVRVYCDGQRRNLNVRLNQMVGLACGSFFVRMDADDVMHPDRLQKQFEVLTRSDSRTVVGSGAYSINRDSQVIGLREASTRQRQGFAARHSFDHPTVAATLDWFREHPYSEHVMYHRAEDAELWCRTTSISTFVVIPEPLLFYREGDSFSFTAFLGTKMGLLNLLRDRYPTPRFRYLSLATKETLQLWVVCLFEALGKAGWILARRYRTLSGADKQVASSVLEHIKRHPLPQILPMGEHYECYDVRSADQFTNEHGAHRSGV